MKAQRQDKKVNLAVAKHLLRRLAPTLIVSAMLLLVAISRAYGIGGNYTPGVMLTGIVSDTYCGADHGIPSVGDPQCTRSCVRLGAQYALVVGRKVFILRGHSFSLDRFAGGKVVVWGRQLGPRTIDVDQVVGWYSEAAQAVK